MPKKIALFSTRCEIIHGFRMLFQTSCSLSVFADIITLQHFALSHTLDFVLVDFQSVTSFYLPHVIGVLKMLPCRFFFIASKAVSLSHVASPSCPILHFPEDIPLLLQRDSASGQTIPAHAEKILARLVGDSAAITAIRGRLYLAARSHIPVLITGETGVGKGLCAELLHLLSDRGQRTMERVNVTAIPEGLAEATLFGTVKGAYTDAVLRAGCFERAHGTTLFLDEIGELKPDMQMKLLYSIENGLYRSVGSDAEKCSDARLIFATNADLKAKIAMGTLRTDFYYRISRFHIHIPPLKERKDDIIPLARHFAAQYGKRLSHLAEEVLTTFTWHGNARQLHHCIERACICTAGEIIAIQDISVE